MSSTTVFRSGARRALRHSVGLQQCLRTQFRRPPFTNLPVQTLAKRTTTTTSRLTSKSQPSTAFTFFSQTQPFRLRNPTILQRLRTTLRSFHSTRRRPNGKPVSPNPTPSLNSAGAGPAAEPNTLGGRLRKLSREYGWSALGVYAALSALDFPFCYLLVTYLGTDRIGEWEHFLVSHIQQIIPTAVKEKWHDWRTAMKKAEHDITGGGQINESVEMAGWGVEEADARHKRDASLATQLALAYAIHKSFIFIRVPLAAAVTPKVVKILRGWGWDIGKRTTKEAKAIKRAALPVKTKRR